LLKYANMNIKQARETHHLVLSFNLGGWKLLLDIRNKALHIHTKK